jgi:pSer/pThr/pTyr-binding forkhead associated (FHA) protein
MADERPIKAMLSWEFNGKHELFLYDTDTVEIGREPGNAVVLDVGQISRRHAVLTCRDDSFEVQDLGSVNGTQVNGEPISGPYLLRDGDQIKLWDVTLTFNLLQQNVHPQITIGREPTLVVHTGAPQPCLVISAGAQEGLKILLVPGTMVIGRATAHSEELDIALQDRAISRPHARIEGTEHGFALADMGSANGTLLNGEEIGEPTLLRDGDVIVMGETTLIFRVK